MIRFGQNQNLASSKSIRSPTVMLLWLILFCKSFNFIFYPI